MNRDNATWIAQLSRDGSEREGALADLREALLRNLRKALSQRPRADDALLEDAVQETLIRVLERLDQFQGRSQFVTWATSIAIHQALGELRRSRWKDVSLDDVLGASGSEGPVVGGTDARPERAAEQRAILETMHALIESDLTDRQRTALLAEMKGMPQDEIARHLGSNRNAVYKLTHDARKKLKKGLEAAGYSTAVLAPSLAK